MQLSNSEENYLKEIFYLSRNEGGKIPNLSIGVRLGLNPPAVTEMLRKLAEKGLIFYSRSEGASLSDEGEILALQVIRKHRLWETFLVKTLGFNWDEVHEVAEQLEHIRSQKLLDELDRFLGFPEFDPHGEPIPNALGIMPHQEALPLNVCQPGAKAQLLAVASRNGDFLQQIQHAGLRLKTNFEVLEVVQDTGDLHIKLETGQSFFVPVSEGPSLLVTVLA